MPRGIWALGLCSMFMDISSELVHSLLPVLLSTVLGASMLTIGLIEGVAEATASLAKVFSGSLGDRLGRRKAAGGVGLWPCCAHQTGLPLAARSHGCSSRASSTASARDPRRPARCTDRRPGARRTARRGLWLRQSLDSVGAFVGPALAILAMGWFAGDVRVVMWVAVLPALLAVAVLVLG